LWGGGKRFFQEGGRHEEGKENVDHAQGKATKRKGKELHALNTKEREKKEKKFSQRGSIRKKD